MLRNDVSYPYPVLRTYLKDYKESFFFSEVNVETTKNTFRLLVDFSVNNEVINKLLTDGVLSYAVYLYCPRTSMREMHYLDSENDYIDVPAENIHLKVEYATYIIVMRDINKYSHEDLEEGFNDIEYDIPRGSVFGIGKAGSFNALFDNDIIKDAKSIIQIKGSDSEKYMKVDLSENTIVVWMPTEQSTMYKNMPKSKNSQNLLHAVVTIPALVEAISTIARAKDGSSPEDEECAERPWFLTIAKAIEELSEITGENERYLYDYPLRTAQMIMNNNSEKALKLIEGKF